MSLSSENILVLISVIIFFIDWYLYPLAPPPILVCGLFSVLSRLPSLRGGCIVFTVSDRLICCVYRPCGADVLCLPSLWGWYVVFTVPERLICCVYRRPWGAGVHFLCLPFFFRSRVGPGSTCLLTYRPSFLWDRWCVVFTVPAGMMYCVSICSHYHPCGAWGRWVVFTVPAGLIQHVLFTVPAGPMCFIPKNSKLTHEK